MGLLGMFGQNESSNSIKEYLDKNAVIIDVRTIEEWNEGHIDGSKHIVLHTVPLHLDKIKSFKRPVIAVCKSGGRSQQATDFLKKNGVDVINGGPWQNVAKHLT